MYVNANTVVGHILYPVYVFYSAMDSESDNVADGVSAFANGDIDTVSTTDHLTKIGVIAVDQRVKRKAKRLLKQHSKDTPNEGTLVHTRYWKNSRKPRNGYKRGLPKKG